MTPTVSLTFPCAICGHDIRGEYEEEDFDYPVFCPKCGRQNRIPTQTTAAPAPPPTPAPPPPVEAPVPAPVAPPPVVETVAATITVAPPVATTRPEPVPVPPPVAVAPPKPVVIVEPPVAKAEPKVPEPFYAAPSQGRIAWRFRPVATARPVVPLRNCVAIDDQGRVIAALGRDLFALTAGESACEVAWKFTANDHIPGSPVVGSQGTIYAHSGDGSLHALDAAGSPLRPPTRVGQALGWSTPIVDASDRVWLCSSTGGLLRVDALGQTSSRPFMRHSNRFDCTGVLRGETLYVGCEDQFLHAIDLQGERGRDRWDVVKKVGLTGWYINSAIALCDASIVAVSRDDQMYSFDESGAVTWSIPLEGRAIGSPIVTQKGVIVVGLTTRREGSGDMAGRLVGVHAKTGQFAWRLDLNAPVESTPVAGDNGEVYAGDNSGRIHAVNAQGQRVWSDSVGSAVRSAGTIHSLGQVVFGLDDGSLVALRCGSKAAYGIWPKLLSTPANRCP